MREGVSEALDLALRALINPGDEVIYHEPCYVSYNPSIQMAFGVPVAVNASPAHDFAVIAADIEKAITPKTKIIMLNFPTNPTGGIEPVAELEKIAALAIKHDLIVITDEIYSELLEFRAGKEGNGIMARHTMGYTDAQLKAVITTGVRPDGSRLKPPMGTAYYANMSAGDLDALVAYLRSLPAK